MANKKDFATSVVATAPSPADSGTSLVVTTGHGARFPAAPFYVTVHPPSEMPTLDNAEKLLVSAKSDDTFTITRSQGDTTAKTIESGWRVSNALFLDDIPSGDVTLTGTQTLTNKTLTTPLIDTISEKTTANGVTIDSLNIKDGKLNTNNSVVTANITDAAVTLGKIAWDTTVSAETPYSKRLYLGNGTNLDTVKTTGVYGYYSRAESPSPFDGICVLEVLAYSPDWVVQKAWEINSDNALGKQRMFHSGNTWTTWRDI